MNAAMDQNLLEGIHASTVQTDRYRAAVLTTVDERPAPPGADALVLVHGNVSCSWFFQLLMLALPFRTVAIDLRGFGASESAPVDARRGLDDFADDLDAVIAALELGRVHLFGWSMGGAVVARQAMAGLSTIASLVLQAPAPPHGVGGTRADGTLLQPDAAGTGGGAANPQFVAQLAAQETSADAGSPRQVYRSLYVAAGHQDTPELGVLPGWPGEEIAPRQPMVTQTRQVLEAYRAAGGSYQELRLPGVGHSPHLERPDEVRDAVIDHLHRAAGTS